MVSSLNNQRDLFVGARPSFSARVIYTLSPARRCEKSEAEIPTERSGKGIPNSFFIGRDIHISACKVCGHFPSFASPIMVTSNFCNLASIGPRIFIRGCWPNFARTVCSESNMQNNLLQSLPAIFPKISAYKDISDINLAAFIPSSLRQIILSPVFVSVSASFSAVFMCSSSICLKFTTGVKYKSFSALRCVYTVDSNFSSSSLNGSASLSLRHFLSMWYIIILYLSAGMEHFVNGCFNNDNKLVWEKFCSSTSIINLR